MVFTVYLCVIIPPFLYFPGRLHRGRKQARLCRAYRPGLPGPFLLLKKSHTNHCSALLFGFIITWNTENRVKILENIRKTLDAFGILSIIRIAKGNSERRGNIRPDLAEDANKVTWNARHNRRPQRQPSPTLSQAKTKERRKTKEMQNAKCRMQNYRALRAAIIYIQRAAFLNFWFRTPDS